MGLNIKNAETLELIRRLADATGETQTAAITEAVRARLEKLERERAKEGRFERIMAIARETGPLMKDFDMDEALYGENGLYDRETGLPK